MRDPDGLSNRRRIYQFIVENPGTYLREMERVLNLQVGVLQHHLNVMTRQDMLTTEDDGHRVMYFSAGTRTLEERRMLASIRLRTPRRIVIQLLREGVQTPGDLVEAQHLTKGAISFQISRLVAKGIVTEECGHGRKSYRLSNPQTAIRLLVMCRTSLLDSLVDSFLDSWSRIE